MSKRRFTIANNPLLSGPTFDDRDRGGIPYRQIPISVIDRDPNQPRVNFDEEKLRELAASIKIYGVLSPLLVRPSKIPGRYMLIAGERRFRAAQLVGLDSVPVLIDQEFEENSDRTLAMQLVENLQRADLSPLERAHAIGALKEAHNLSVRDIADRLGISKSMVQRSLEILELPDDLLNALREGASESKILLLSKISDPEIRSSYLKDIEVLTRKQLEKDIDKRSANKEDAPTSALSAEDQRITDEIQRALGLKVRMTRVEPGADAGKLIIEFYSDADLQEVFRKLIAA
ncbi:MAG: ParB/RepB/Spo0J family partition protein [Oligoflexia bacterium]|nr:ParB/RepB/Spo0J family partition protein [Oligoflexia bacterium]